MRSNGMHGPLGAKVSVGIGFRFGQGEDSTGRIGAGVGMALSGLGWALFAVCVLVSGGFG